MKAIKYTFFLTFLLTLFACESKEEILTPGEKIAQQLTSVINEYQINKTNVYTLRYFDGGAYLTQFAIEKNFTLNVSFIIVEETYFNLNKLDRFEVSYDDSIYYLNLYFLQ
jgi:hypothetical protein